jgi:hypothetical protein
MSNRSTDHDQPLDHVSAATESEGVGKDLFYHGTIHRLSSKKNTGIVRTSSGREIPFSFELVTLVGPVKKPYELREGLVVGYDMSWTADGLKVTKIKTYRRAGEEQVNAPASTADSTAGKAEEGSERE